MNRFFDLLHLFLGDGYVLSLKNIMTPRGNLGSELANFVKRNVAKYYKTDFSLTCFVLLFYFSCLSLDTFWFFVECFC